MLKQRVITAAVLLVVFVGVFFFANLAVFQLVMAIVAAAAAYEWAVLSGFSSLEAQLSSAAVGFVSMLALMFLVPSGLFSVAVWLALLFWLYALHQLRTAPVRLSIRRADWFGFLPGAGLIVVTVLSLYWFRFNAPGASTWLLLYVLSIVWVMDTGAYFAGKRFGRVKLAPAISPGKTQEGVIGGIAAACSLFLLSMLFGAWPAGSFWAVFLATLIAAPFSVVGDLYESRLKRAAGAKDSSNLLPGHGGVLDRIDGVLATVPMFAAIYLWLAPSA